MSFGLLSTIVLCRTAFFFNREVGRYEAAETDRTNDATGERDYST